MLRVQPLELGDFPFLKHFVTIKMSVDDLGTHMNAG
jgi:hypothetical protein